MWQMASSSSSSSSSHPHDGGGMTSAAQHHVYSTRHARILSIIISSACSGVEESVIEDGDTLTFISTLHGG
jgi:hypothetical protein